MGKRAGACRPTFAIALTAGLAVAIAALALSAARHLLRPRRNQDRAVYARTGGDKAKLLTSCASPDALLAELRPGVRRLCGAGLPKMVLGRGAKNEHLGPGATYDNIRYVRGEFWPDGFTVPGRLHNACYR